MANSDTDRLDDLRSKFLRMTSPQEFGQKRKKNVTITSRNVPPMLARADAAFVVLAEKLQTTTAAFLNYDLLLAVAQEARDQVKDADLLTKADKIHADFSDLFESLAFLVCNLKALKVVAEAKNDFSQSPESICTAIYPTPEHQKLFYGDIEQQILKNLQDALAGLCPAFLEKRKLFLESLSKADMERFSRAHEEFSAHFKNVTNS